MKNLMVALRMIVCMTILTGLVYPFVVTGLAQTLFPYKANGSLIVQNGKVVGSELIGQAFGSDRYFWSRPSAVGYNPLPSGGSNLGPTSAQLAKQVTERRAQLSSNSGNPDSIPPDLLFASGSGLDPHISPEAARFQISRVSRARNLDTLQTNKVEALVERYIETPDFEFFGMPRVNVLKLNLALDSLLQ